MVTVRLNSAELAMLKHLCVLAMLSDSELSAKNLSERFRVMLKYVYDVVEGA